jgi:hypothetical protein
MKAKHCFLVTMAAIVVLLLVPLPAAARQTQSAPQAPGDGASIGRAIDYLKGRLQCGPSAGSPRPGRT